MAPQARPVRNTPSPSLKTEESVETNEVEVPPLKKRRGRPPGTKNKPRVAAETNGSGEAPVEKPKRTRNVRPTMPIFFEDIETGELTPLGSYKGNTAEEAFDTYLAALDSDDERQAAYAAANYVVFPEAGVSLGVVPPTEPSIARR